ncbi:TPA_asm: transcriptional regulator, partial [Listeria monocytogenes]|nr:transcriptional regulator [Listeria monocytogenes]
MGVLEFGEKLIHLRKKNRLTQK